MNGFPEKKVSLPLEKMYEVADEKGENLNTILDEMKVLGIDHDKEEDKIIFKSALPNMTGDSIKRAQEMMAKMDPEELKKIQEQIVNMTPEEKEKLLEQAKAFGLF